ncbi:MAG: hypothetical protein HKM23_08900 [Nitrosopumilus sp.]|nr:hypothetical protein [Nitrosopumilus sp.]NNM02813.1 hypothetical protein [Nitrosopumilus sp.]
MSENDISEMFQSESQKLENLIKSAESKPELSIHEIVETYYQVMNVSSMSSMLKQQNQTNENSGLNEKIQTMEKIISETFNSNIHPKITKQLSDSIEEITKNLQSKNSQDKTKEDIQSESKKYDELRKVMSTKEFVKQYDDGL